MVDLTGLERAVSELTACAATVGVQARSLRLRAEQVRWQSPAASAFGAALHDLLLRVQHGERRLTALATTVEHHARATETRERQLAQLQDPVRAGLRVVADLL